MQTRTLRQHLTNAGRQRTLLVTLVTWFQHVPLRDRRALAAQHADPMVLLLRSGGLLSEHNPPDDIVLALRVIIPDAHNQDTVIHHFRRDVEA